MKKQLLENQIIIYESDDGKAQVEVHFEDENVWLTQAQMSELFDRDQSIISRHIANVYTEGELEEKSTMQNMHIANSDKPVTCYNLNVIGCHTQFGMALHYISMNWLFELSRS